MQPLWVPVGFTVKSFLFFCTHVTCYNPASKMATVPLKVTWKVSVNIALSLAFILAELNPERKFSPEIPNSLKTTGIFFNSIYYTRMKSWMSQSLGVEIYDGVMATDKLIWMTQSGSPLDSPAQYYSRGGEHHWNDAQNLPQSCLWKSLEWTDSGGHARQTRGLFLHPSKKGLTLLFTLPVKYYRSFM